jgi:hypothetical protein
LDNADIKQIQAERDKYLNILLTIVRGDVGRHMAWKLSEGQGTETVDGKAWLEAIALSKLVHTR